MNSPIHVPVLLKEVLEWSQIEAGHVFVDGTLGGGGHAREVVKRLGMGGRLIGVDRDPVAIDRVRADLTSWFESSSIAEDGPRIDLVCDSYASMTSILDGLSIPKVDRILLDLGLSSDQLADSQRGFSFKQDGPLDLRFDPTSGPSASELMARLPEEELANLIYRYGEERFSRRIAKGIVWARRGRPIETTRQLYDLIHRSVPGRTHGRIDSATRTFQALRIAVNSELKHLETALESLPSLLAPEGRLLIISFHSLEDRMVKNAFRSSPLLENLTKKPIIPSLAEVGRNPRSRSAKLRVAQRIP